MRNIDLAPYYRSSVGFDRMLNTLGRSQRSPEAEAALPPYNIELVDEDRYRITMALAGYSSDDLDIVAEANILRIQAENPALGSERNFLHCGIIVAPFRCQFELADFVVVAGASLENGLLSIELERQLPEAMKPRRIEITAQHSNGRPSSQRQGSGALEASSSA